MKCHKDHVDREEACITMCNGKSIEMFHSNACKTAIKAIQESMEV